MDGEGGAGDGKAKRAQRAFFPRQRGCAEPHPLCGILERSRYIFIDKIGGGGKAVRPTAGPKVGIKWVRFFLLVATTIRYRMKAQYPALFSFCVPSNEKIKNQPGVLAGIIRLRP
jgi:hypothetical protein